MTRPRRRAVRFGSLDDIRKWVRKDLYPIILKWHLLTGLPGELTDNPELLQPLGLPASLRTGLYGLYGLLMSIETRLMQGTLLVHPNKSDAQATQVPFSAAESILSAPSPLLGTRIYFAANKEISPTPLDILVANQPVK